VSAYGVHNLPYCVFLGASGRPTIGVRIEDDVLDLAAAEREGLVAAGGTLQATTLNAFMALGRPAWDRVRAQATSLLTGVPDRAAALRQPLSGVTMRLPFEVADYVDFYSSEQHAANVGQIFRPGAPPPTPNWKHVPIGYHGRAGTVVVSGTDVVRPKGQRKAPDEERPSFGPSVRLDIEAEVGFVVGTPTSLGETVTTADLAEHVFGVVLLNDWSARDIQAWEYVPLGPFLGKSFATSVSPWIVPLAALENARVAPPPRDPRPLPYLDDTSGPAWGLDLALEVRLNGHVIARPPFATMYWTPAQMLAHMTVNGASLRTGDLFASGTVSGPEAGRRGSLIELTTNGSHPIALPNGSERGFLDDGDEVVITATAPGPDGALIGFGEVRGRVTA